MIAKTLLHDLAARGVILSASGDQLDVDAPDEVLTDDLLTTLRDHKVALLALLRSEPDAIEEPEEFILKPPAAPERPRLGSCARPMPVRGAKGRLGDSCLWTNCPGFLTGRGPTLYYCSTCGTWFELLPLENGLREALRRSEALDARPHSNDYTDWTEFVM